MLACVCVCVLSSASGFGHDGVACSTVDRQVFLHGMCLGTVGNALLHSAACMHLLVACMLLQRVILHACVLAHCTSHVVACWRPSRTPALSTAHLALSQAWQSSPFCLLHSATPMPTVVIVRLKATFNQGTCYMSAATVLHVSLQCDME